MSSATETVEPLLGVYTQPDLVLARGEGSWVWDEDGRRYLDFTAGIAVNALGHASPHVRNAVRKALDSGLIHTSNLYRTRPAEELARLLVAESFPGQVFFCNSGAEANEAALKFARRWAGKASGPEQHEFVAFRGSFHGRLFGSLALTDRESYQAPFRPLMPGTHLVDVGDVDALESLLRSGRVAGVLIEPVQGEGGIRPVPHGFLRTLRSLCDRHGSLLIFDEVQCGLGRTGRLFAWQHAGVVPDMMTLAKPLAAGLPMGAVVLGSHVAAAVEPGDHATTFGGGPLVASVALAVLRTLSNPEFLRDVATSGHRLEAGLEGLGTRVSRVTEVRGLGLLQGVVLDGPVAAVIAKARTLGLLVASAGPDVIRLVPPLNTEPTLLDLGLGLLEEAMT